jgi:hypothetical protein
MNVEIGAQAAQFPEKEYLNGIAFAVRVRNERTSSHTMIRSWVEFFYIYAEPTSFYTDDEQL